MQSHNHSPAHSRDDDTDPPGPYLRRLRDVPQDTVRRLAEEIGRRPATSLGEARAAAYLDGRLRRAGLRASADTFPARPIPGWEGVLSGGLILLALILYYWQPLGAALLQVAALILTGISFGRRGAPLIERQRLSQNVIATRAAADELRHRLVLLAALDTPAIPRRLAQRLGGSVVSLARLIAALLIVVLGLIGLFDPQRLWFFLQFLPALYLIATAILDLLGKRGLLAPQSADAAGIAVLLASCEALDELQHTELWAIGLGASLSEVGLADVLRRYPFDSTTLFIGLEGLGNGQPVFLTHAGWPGQPADQQLVEVATRLGSDPRILIGPLRAASIPTMTAALPLAGHRAMTVACQGPSRTIVDDDEALNRATRLVIAIARAIDAS